MKFEGEKYFVLQADDDRIIGKKGSTGFFIYKTGQGKEKNKHLLCTYPIRKLTLC